MRMGFEVAARIPSGGCNDAMAGWHWVKVGPRGRTKIGSKERAKRERAKIGPRLGTKGRPRVGPDGL